MKPESSRTFLPALPSEFFKSSSPQILFWIKSETFHSAKLEANIELQVRPFKYYVTERKYATEKLKSPNTISKQINHWNKILRIENTEIKSV